MRYTEKALVAALARLHRRSERRLRRIENAEAEREAMGEALVTAARRTGELVIERDKLTQEVARLRGEAARVAVDLERCTKERDAARADARRLAGVNVAPVVAAPTTSSTFSTITLEGRRA